MDESLVLLLAAAVRDGRLTVSEAEARCQTFDEYQLLCCELERGRDDD